MADPLTVVSPIAYWVGHFGVRPAGGPASATCVLIVAEGAGAMPWVECGKEGVLTAISTFQRGRVTACAEHADLLREATWSVGIRELNLGDEVERLRAELAAKP